MLNESQVNDMKNRQRYITEATEGDEKLGPLKLLPVVWKNEPNLPGRG